MSLPKNENCYNTGLQQILRPHQSHSDPWVIQPRLMVPVQAESLVEQATGCRLLPAPTSARLHRYFSPHNGHLLRPNQTRRCPKIKRRHTPMRLRTVSDKKMAPIPLCCTTTKSGAARASRAGAKKKQKSRYAKNSCRDPPP